MTTRRHALTAVPLALASLAAAPAAAQTTIADDFEAYDLGAFPAANWLDAAEILDPPAAPVPSCTVETTTGPDGAPTQAVSTVEFNGWSQGLYRFVPVSERYIVSAELRVDRMVDTPFSETSDWTWEVGVGKFTPGTDLGAVPQTGIYGSCFTGGWRLYALGTTGTYADIDLGLPLELGRWYHVEMDLDAARGIVRSRISDATTGALLTDRIDQIEGWTPADGEYDLLNFFESDTGVEPTRSNLCVIDNIRAVLFGSPCPGDFNADGEVSTLDVLAFLNAWAAGCP